MPGPQAKHRGAFEFSLNVPGAHAVSLAEPTEQNVPSEHVRQSPSLVMNGSVTSMRLPPGHGSGAAEPSAQ